MEQNINFDRMEQAAELFGSFDENIRLIEKEYHVTLLFRDSELKITGTRRMWPVPYVRYTVCSHFSAVEKR